jgi:hypothetical protein
MKRKRVSDYQKYKRKKSRVEVALREEARKEAEKRRREEVIVATVEDVAEEATGTGEDSNNDSEGLLTSETAVQTELSMEDIRYMERSVISFVSKGWGGRVSDKHLTENCGILNFLQPGDVILADRGFTVQDSVGLCCAEVKMPPFTRGKKQLSRSATNTARQLSHVRRY